MSNSHNEPFTNSIQAKEQHIFFALETLIFYMGEMLLAGCRSRIGGLRPSNGRNSWNNMKP